MNYILREKYESVKYSDVQMQLIIDIVKESKDALKILELITDSTKTKNNPNVNGITKGDIISYLRKEYKEDFSKHACNNAINLLNGPGLIYFKENLRGKAYQLTIRGAELVIKMRKMGILGRSIKDEN
ncbi:hypothetical protein SH1V18_48080 [Vallitalea longa]|uniref:Uncharacterized protein n=1 Tax=Vallitalea longa TaxID=2936439 RepID=A0A9W6DIB5_9FIRM|nr:hypothetical protein [Vallitalea longa]GKX32328.1 hypothetical protein SH1V18_48080 [Vallitalea longa]